MIVSVREFKAKLSRYLKLAQVDPNGLQITSHGKTVARVLGLPPNADDATSRLLKSGAAQWSGRAPVWEPPVELSEGGRLVSDIVLDERR